MFFERINDLHVGRFLPFFSNPSIIHGISTRKGGVSRPPYESLNLGENVGDSSCCVKENRRKFFSSLGISVKDIAFPVQVHGDVVRYARRPGTFPKTDGLVTNISNIVLTVQTADCLPVFIFDSVHMAVGLIHVGWRGCVKKITLRALDKMYSEFGSNPGDLNIVFGPSIRSCCYEVGDELTRLFPSGYVDNGHLDICLFNRDLLVKGGVRPENITATRVCTCCHQEWFFSHRASGGRTGRMIAFLALVSN